MFLKVSKWPLWWLPLEAIKWCRHNNATSIILSCWFHSIAIIFWTKRKENSAMADSDEEREIEQLAQVSSMLTPRSSMIDVSGGRRVSRASFNFFQHETTVERGDHGLIGRDGKVRDEYIVKRQSINKPAILKTIPLLADLTTDIRVVDGWVLTQLLLSGFAKMSTKIDELNKINVFPIADGEWKQLPGRHSSSWCRNKSYNCNLLQVTPAWTWRFASSYPLGI